MRSHEWKPLEEVWIPLVEHVGFTDEVIIRKWAYVRRVSTGQKIKIEKTAFTLGKSKLVDFAVTDNDTISRKHAVIEKKSDGYYLKDLDSTNHTYVNDRLVTEPVKLKDGMQFRLARECFEFTIS